MIKVAALTSGRNVPSARFRVRQHIKALREHNIEVREFVPRIDKFEAFPKIARFQSPKVNAIIRFILGHGLKLCTRVPGVIGSWKGQITWLERELLPGCYTFEPLLKKPTIFDVDDAIWLSRPFGSIMTRKIASKAEAVLAGNNHIAQYVSGWCKNIHIVPTAIDVDRFRPPENSDILRTDTFTVGWTGTQSNLHELEKIEVPLKSFIEGHSGSEILIVCDQAPNLKTIPSTKIRYIEWSPENEHVAVQQMDVGIMPLSDTPWTRGKCSFKMLQYMACGIPVIASPVGMNRTVLRMSTFGLAAESHRDWFQALSFFCRNRDIRDEYGKAGRYVVEKNFSVNVISQMLADIFRKTAKKVSNQHGCE
jgi:glycosyltransferase involved in cell wall biosynthesis